VFQEQTLCRSTPATANRQMRLRVSPSS